MSNKEITTWKIPQEYIDQQQKIQAQDKLIEELEAALIHYAFGEKIYRIDNTVERGTARKALAKIKEYREK